MPVSRRRAATAKPLPTPQARVLAALMPKEEYRREGYECEWSVITRPNLGVCAGYTAASGTVTRALNGLSARRIRGLPPRGGYWTLVGVEDGEQVWSGSNSGTPHLGVIDLGYVEVIVLDLDGVKETNYRITHAGIRAYLAHVALAGEMPPVRDAVKSTNTTRGYTAGQHQQDRYTNRRRK